MSALQKALRFVAQRHQARTLHFDFRLEKEDVFKSWAVPKGLPEEPGVQRLALATEDHDLAFGDFAGAIPAGQPGAGMIERFDDEPPITTGTDSQWRLRNDNRRLLRFRGRGRLRGR